MGVCTVSRDTRWHEGPLNSERYRGQPHPGCQAINGACLWRSPNAPSGARQRTSRAAMSAQVRTLQCTCCALLHMEGNLNNTTWRRRVQEQPESCHSQNAISVYGLMDVRARRSCCWMGEVRPPSTHSVVNAELAEASGKTGQTNFLLKYCANVGEHHHWCIAAVLPSRGDNQRNLANQVKTSASPWLANLNMS